MRSTESKNTQQTYQFDITRYYRIWFSKNADIFLGAENELRFIRMRNANPKAKLFFIYSSQCLNTSSLNNLKNFCIRHKITPIDFDTEIPDLLKSQADKTIYKIAQQEIQRTITQNHGNLAAASDCVRLLVPVIEKFGIYTDFDVECSLSQVGSTLTLPAPVLLNGEILIVFGTHDLLNPNSDFLAFSHASNNPSKLSTAALTAIHFIQNELIKNYTQPLTTSTLLTNINPEKFKDYPDLPRILKEFYKTIPESKQHTVFDFRKYVFNLTLPEETVSKFQVIEKFFNSIFTNSTTEKQKLDALKIFLTKNSVCNISGPGLYFVMYKHLYPKNATHPPIFFSAKTVDWFSYLKFFIKSCIADYPQLARYIKSKNSMNEMAKLTSAPKYGDFFDQSWLEPGEQSKKLREDKMHHAARTLQFFWRKKSSTQKFNRDNSYKI